MTLYIVGTIVLIFFVLFGFWASQEQKKRLKKAETFYALPQIKAMLDSGFVKDEDGINGRINNYPAGVYCWFDATGTRYFTYLGLSARGGFSVAYRISEKYHTKERVRIKDMQLQQELAQIDGETLAKSFARLQEIAALEKLEPVKL